MTLTFFFLEKNGVYKRFLFRDCGFIIFRKIGCRHVNRFSIFFPISTNQIDLFFRGFPKLNRKILKIYWQNINLWRGGVLTDFNRFSIDFLTSAERSLSVLYLNLSTNFRIQMQNRETSLSFFRVWCNLACRKIEKSNDYNVK